MIFSYFIKIFDNFTYILILLRAFIRELGSLSVRLSFCDSTTLRILVSLISDLPVSIKGSVLFRLLKNVKSFSRSSKLPFEIRSGTEIDLWKILDWDRHWDRKLGNRNPRGIEMPNFCRSLVTFEFRTVYF